MALSATRDPNQLEPATIGVGLACPNCRTPIIGDTSANELQCTSCNAIYPRVDQVVIDFLAKTERPENRYGDMFGARAQEYDQRFSVDSKHASWVLRRVDEIAPEVTSQLAGRVIEIGAGTGPLTQALLERKPPLDFWVTDLSSEMLALNWQKMGNKRGSAKYARCNVLQLPFEDESADAVVGFDILHHVLDYRKGLAEIARVLRPGGVCMLKEPVRDAHRVLAFLSWQLQFADRNGDRRKDFTAPNLYRQWWRALGFRNNDYRPGLTTRDHERFERYRSHVLDMTRASENNDLKKLAQWDDKYLFRLDQLGEEASAAGFGRFQEANVLQRTRPSQLAYNMYYGNMIRNWLRGIGVSEQGRAWCEESVAKMDFWIGDFLLRVAPKNTIVLLWK